MLFRFSPESDGSPRRYLLPFRMGKLAKALSLVLGLLSSSSPAQYSATVFQANSSAFAIDNGLVGGSFNGQAHLWQGALPGLSIHPTTFATSEVRVIRGRQKGGSGRPAGALLDHALYWQSANVGSDLNPGPLSKSSGIASLEGLLQVGYWIPASGSSNYTSGCIWAGTPQGFSWIVTGLGPVLFSALTGISGNNQVGYAHLTTLNTTHAVTYKNTAIAIDLEPGTLVPSAAAAVSGNLKVGHKGASWNWHARLWDANNVATDLHQFLNPLSFDFSQALGIRGTEVVGFAGHSSQEVPKAVVWHFVPQVTSNSTAEDLHQYLPSTFVSSKAWAVDLCGNVVGEATDSSGVTHAVLWRKVAPVPGWLQKTQLPSTVSGRYYSAAFSLDDNAYLVGGLSATNVAYNNCYQWSRATNSWTASAPIPPGPGGEPDIWLASGAAVEGMGYVFGGRREGAGFGQIDTGELWRYDPNGNTWSKRSPFPGVTRYGAAVFAIEDKLYVIGGAHLITLYSWSYLNDCWSYDTLTDQWASVAGLPGNGTFLASTFVINGKGYVLCGQDQTGLRTEVFEFDPTIGTGGSWTQKTSLPSAARSDAVGVSLNGFGYLLTGRKVGQSSNIVQLKEAWRFDPTGAGSWLQLPQFPGLARSGAVGVVIGCKAYIGTGGHTAQSGFVPFKDWWEFVP